MLPTPANSQDLLNDITQLNAMLAAKGMALPPDWTTMPTDAKQHFLNDLMQDSQKTHDISQHVHDFAKDQQEVTQELDQSGVNMPAAYASKKAFNLKRAQMGPGQAMQTPEVPQPGVMSPQQQQPQQGQTGCPEQFADAGQLRDCLKSFGSANEAIKFVSEKYTNSNQMVSDPNSPQRAGEALGVVKDAVNDFYSTNDPTVQLRAAMTIFDTILPDSAKMQQPDNGSIPTQLDTNVQPSTMSMVQSTNALVKKMAEEFAAKQTVKKAQSSYNLKKEAQHQSVHNVIYFGPHQNKIDAFTGQLISDWHLIERNKGFGLKIDDVLDIDFEAIWRGTIMDKYSRPYRDKKGNWVGGYIESRFEVDKNIPPLNDYQLKPGELRRPILPEYGTTEARMQASRDKMNSERGYKPSSDGKPHDWQKDTIQEKSASLSTPGHPKAKPTSFNLAETKKKITAQLEPPQNDGFKLPGDVPNKSVGQNPMCPFCGGHLGKTQNGIDPGVCKNCGKRVPAPTMMNPHLPSVGVPQQAVQTNQRLGSHQIEGIFFDGKKFIVYANQKRAEFATMEEAENFTKQPSVEVTPAEIADETHPIKSKLDPRKREMYDIADNLGIDG